MALNIKNAEVEALAAELGDLTGACPPAAFNLGDCMAYAVAQLSGEPLFFVGDDFSLTDLEVA